MVAASKMRKAQQSALAGRPYANLMNSVLGQVGFDAGDFRHPLMEKRDGNRRALILVSTDKGLCGGLNSNLFRTVAQIDPATTVYIAVGKRAAQFVARSRRELRAEFTITDSPRFDEARPIATFARDLFLNREVDRVDIVFSRFVNTMTQQPIVVPFLPIGEISLIAEDHSELSDAGAEVIFEPKPEAVLGYLFRIYLNIFIYRILLEAKASEQSARMVAMTSATDNASALIKDLTLEYNKLRQGSITQELLEIAGGQAG